MLDEKGFYRKNYNDILTDLEEQAKQLFGSDINTEETSPLGKFIRIIAYAMDGLWEDVEGAYYSGFISTARGVSLDRLSTSLAISRYLEAPAKAIVKITGTANYTVPLGFVVATESGVQYTTTEDVTLGTDGTATTEVMCLEYGAKGNALAGQINVIVNPDADVSSVKNEENAYSGRDKESDVSFRERIISSIGSTEGSTTDAILGAILKLDNVKSVAIKENSGSTVDNDGRPPHSFEVYVQGGTDKEIAETIFEKKPLGVQTHGTTTVEVLDISKTKHDVKFSRPVIQPIYVKVNLKVNNEFDSLNDIKTGIISYIGGTDADNTYYYGLNMNEDVVHSRLISIASKLTGVEDVTIKICKDGASYLAQNITIDSNTIAETDYSKVSVEVTL